MVNRYVTERGDIVWLDFDPQTGKEQKGRRPALVLSHEIYNKKVGLCLFCPVTSKVKGYPFEVVIPDHNQVRGVILSDQVRSLDWTVRNVEYIDRVDHRTLQKVISLIQKLFN